MILQERTVLVKEQRHEIVGDNAWITPHLVLCGLELLLELSQVCYTNSNELGLYPQSLGLYGRVPGSESCFIIVFLKVFFV